MDRKLLLILLASAVLTVAVLYLPEPAPWNDPCSGRNPNAPGWVCDLRAKLGM